MSKDRLLGVLIGLLFLLVLLERLGFAKFDLPKSQVDVFEGLDGEQALAASPALEDSGKEEQEIVKEFDDSSITEATQIAWNKQSIDLVLPKKVFWQGPRVIFVSGVSESGFKPFASSVQAICASNKKIRCEAVCSISPTDLFYADLVKHRAAAERRLRKGFVEIRDRVKKNPSQNTIFFISGLACGTNDDDLQYPSRKNWGAESVPDMHWLAAVAEQEGIDLRLVPLLLPSNGDVTTHVRLVSRKKYTTWPNMMVAKGFENALQVMYSQLSALDSAFYRAVELGNEDFSHTLSLGSQNGKLDAWLGLPGLENELSHRLAKIVVDKRAAESAIRSELPGTNPDEGIDTYSAELMIARDQLADLAAKNVRSEPLVIKHEISSADRPRAKLVFFAGLEGTGHHLWMEAVIQLMKDGELFPACSVSKLLFENHNLNTMWFARAADKYSNSTTKLRTRLNALVRRDGGRGRTYLSNLMQSKTFCDGHGSGMMSYPNYISQFHSLQRPNLVTLARACEDAGIDLRIVKLVRDSRKIIRSTADHRRFGGGGHVGEAVELRSLTINAHAYYAQTSALDKAFFVYCFDQDDKLLPGLAPLAEALGLPGLPRVVNTLAHFPKEATAEVRKREHYIDIRRGSMLFSMRTAEKRIRAQC